jgi:predicted PurR-regulated permease PerM
MANPAPSKDLGGFIARVLAAATIIGLILLVWQFRQLVLLVFGAILASVILRLIASPINRYLRIRSSLALAVAVLLVAAIIALAIWFFGADIGNQTRSLSQMLPDAWQNLQDRLQRAGWGEPLDRWLENVRSSAVSNIGHFALAAGGGLGTTILVIVGGIFIAAQPELYQTGLIKLIPPRQRGLGSDAINEAGVALGLWLKGRMVSMAIVATLTAFGLYLIGVPSWLALGLLSGLLEFIPFVGPIISAIPAVLLALAASPQAALWTVALYVIVQQIEGNIIEPLVQQRAVSIPPALLMFGLLAASLIFGIGGVVLGAPLTVVIFVLVKRLYVREALDTDIPLPTDQEG